VQVLQKHRVVVAVGFHPEAVGDPVGVLEQADDVDGLDRLLAGPAGGEERVPVGAGDAGRLPAQLVGEVQ
jgi:hypothetical protein